MITRAEVDKLAQLARLAMSAEEKDSLHTDLEHILQYVSVLPAETAQTSKTKPELFNVLRADEKPDEPGRYTADLLAAMADRQGDFMKVKKIIDKGL